MSFRAAHNGVQRVDLNWPAAARWDLPFAREYVLYWAGRYDEGQVKVGDLMRLGIRSHQATSKRCAPL